jgi:hypothetical protein
MTSPNYREADADDRGRAVIHTPILQGDDKHMIDLTSLESPRLVTVAVLFFTLTSLRVMMSL